MKTLTEIELKFLVPVAARAALAAEIARGSASLKRSTLAARYLDTADRRLARRVRSRGAVVEVAFDKGQLSAAGATQRIHEVEFELVSGSATAMLALRVEHVHQLRVGIRRLRSALRSFRGWAPSPPADLVDGLHTLRKRIKRQRYAVEFFAPVLRRRQVERYLKLLTALQDRVGELNDLFVARGRCQALVVSDPAAWFALGWLAARIVQSRTLAKPELERLAKGSPPKA